MRYYWKKTRPVLIRPITTRHQPLFRFRLNIRFNRISSSVLFNYWQFTFPLSKIITVGRWVKRSEMTFTFNIASQIFYLLVFHWVLQQSSTVY
jgi:hypothetical protein